MSKPAQCDAQQLAKITHDFRSPLNGIIGFAEMLHDEKLGTLSTEQKDCLQDILTSAQHLLWLVNDIQDFAKVSAGQVQLHPETLSLSTILLEMQKMFLPMAQCKKITLTAILDSSLQEVRLDPLRFKQVLFNLVSNALKFTPQNGHVEVRILPESEHHFRLEVKDDGIGIRQEDLSRLFLAFEQLDCQTQYPGTGLGLALAKQWVELLGGKMGVDSERGKGSLFYAIFPIRSG